MKNMVMYKAGEHSWVNYIKNRIKSNLNFLAVAEGSTGIGKSWAMVSLAYEIDPSFEIRQVAFSFREVMTIINSDWFKKKKWKIILFDEPQTDISNRAWQSLTNKLMNFLVSTFRHQNIILLFATPYSDFIDSATMKLIHCKFIVKGHNKNTKMTTLRPKLQQYNSKMRKFYEHSLMVSSKKGTTKQTHWMLPAPPKHLIDPYEEAKSEFTSALNLDIQEQLDEASRKEQKKRGKREEERGGLTEKQERALQLMQVHKKQTLVAEEMGISTSTLSQHLRFAKKKGHTPENYKNQNEIEEIS